MMHIIKTDQLTYEERTALANWAAVKSAAQTV